MCHEVIQYNSHEVAVQVVAKSKRCHWLRYLLHIHGTASLFRPALKMAIALRHVKEMSIVAAAAAAAFRPLIICKFTRGLATLFAAQRCTSILVFVARPILIEMLLKLPVTRPPSGSIQSLQEPVSEGFRLFLSIVESYQGWRLDIRLEEWQD